MDKLGTAKETSILVSGYNQEKNKVKWDQKNRNHLQQGMPDATRTSGDKRVVFSPNSARAAGDQILYLLNWRTKKIFSAETPKYLHLKVNKRVAR